MVNIKKDIEEMRVTLTAENLSEEDQLRNLDLEELLKKHNIPVGGELVLKDSRTVHTYKRENETAFTADWKPL